jgi:formylglycine-generating enzyme required for sulfatase activity
VEYCNWLSEKESLTPAYTIDKNTRDPNNENEKDTLAWLVTWNKTANGYRLLTEAEREYACRAGTTTAYNTGPGITPDDANYEKSSDYGDQRAEVGSYSPNAFDLYDMHGNMYDWCWDWYGEYDTDPVDNPDGPVSGESRVIRGGCWSHPKDSMRSA